MKIDGSCHCGAITYEAEIDPEKVAICHCTDCQVLSGTAFRTVVPVRVSDFTLKSGAVKTYIKTGESGNRRAQTFCPECGTPFYSTTTDDDPKIFNLRLGSIRQRNELRPKQQIWTRSAHDWLGGIGELPGLEKQGS